MSSRWQTVIATMTLGQLLTVVHHRSPVVLEDYVDHIRIPVFMRKQDLLEEIPPAA